jgi:hypothetical protein
MHYLPDDFRLVIYYDDSVPSYMIENYAKFENVVLVKKGRSSGRTGCFWRYEAYDDYDLVLFRDIDVPFEPNDRIVLDDFLKKERDIFWVFLVHPRRPYPKQGFVMGGVFGIKKTSSIPSMKKLLDAWKNKGHYGSDEEFLSLSIYNLVPPVCYYEPRPTVTRTVKLKNDYESYVPLAENYKLKKYDA